jgi:NAD(P)-dependent dehydrogenase (short-subunit alcohol dehydrogenase family)
MIITGNTFIVTGGTGGIGGAAARMVLAEGGNVALLDVVPEAKGQAVAEEMVAETKAARTNGKTAQVRAMYVNVDITDSDAVKVAVAAVVEQLGNLKGVVHCAGVAIKRPWTNDAADSIPNFKKVRALTH